MILALPAQGVWHGTFGMKNFTSQPGVTLCRCSILAAPDLRLQSRDLAVRTLQRRGRARLQMGKVMAAGSPHRNEE